MMGRSLRTQLVFAMSLCVAATVVIAFSIATMLMQRQDEQFLRSLSPAAISIRADLAAGRPVDANPATVELLSAWQTSYGDVKIVDDGILAAIALASIAFGVAIALALATTLSKPLHGISVAARRVADGDLSARASPVRGTVGETARLIDDFNTMAAAVEQLQRQMIESSAAIAHELRTPVAVLRGRLEAMRQGLFVIDEPSIIVLIPQVELLGRIIEDLAIVSLSASGQLRVRPALVDLAVLMDELLPSIEPEMLAARIAVERQLKPSWVYADPDRIKQAVFALLDNARRHAADGQQVTLQTGIRNAAAFVSVTDAGPGLPAEARERMFEPFWRYDPSRSRDRGGSGLGLSVVASIASAHGGAVTATLGTGGGLIVEITLSAVDPPAPNTA